MILVIDDDIAVCSSLGLLLKQAGYTADTADGPEAALQRLAEQTPDLIILDMNYSVATSGEEGLKLLGEIRQRLPNVPVILMTAWGSIQLAVEGIKAGAVDFITKPWSNAHVVNAVKTALSLRADQTDQGMVGEKRIDFDERYDFEKLIGEDVSFLDVLRTAARVAQTEASVLIMGESGTGKELLAEAIHVNSPRVRGPFVKVNLGGISSTLFESEMFGHKRGAFTDAKSDRIGRFAMADGGTIFLDEIGEIDHNSQVKLLRVLQDRTYEVLGASIPSSADFRLICATNRKLSKMVADQTFREDLFYRINLITLTLPSLRQRMEDIPLLVNYFIDNIRTIYNRESLSVTLKALQWLKEIPWSGNVRELKNVVERTVLMTGRDELDIEDFRSQLQGDSRKVRKDTLPAVGSVTIEEMERSMIQKALEFHDCNISKVARSLGLSRAALYRRLEKYGISV